MKRNVTTLILCGFLLLGYTNVHAETFTLPELPYALDALAPKISKQTMELHYGKHLQTYVNNLNTLIAGSPFETSDLEFIVKNADGAIFNNAAQLWNHALYFEQFSSAPQSQPGGELATAIDKSFGSFDNFKEQFNKAAAGLFGSGWVWLVKNEDGSLSITQESNAGNPLRSGQQVLMGCDVWEHAYYLDYQNRRNEYINAFWEILDWSVIEKRL
ncbi:MAG: superoxide dismutase [Prevotellaceae bacterium]|jgi:Fe-Mn family superoxide dismutase|nr:superoxide dismutase [Prevotellaceae bacterium]